MYVLFELMVGVIEIDLNRYENILSTSNRWMLQSHTLEYVWITQV